MTKTITTAEELATQPEGTIVRAHWLDGSQPDHFVVRIGESGGAATGQFTLASTRQWLALANWGAELTVFSRPFQPTEPARCAPSREELLQALNAPVHAPMGTHHPGTGECLQCPWPVHEMPAGDIADAVLELFANAPTVEQVKAEALREAKEWIEEHSSNWTNYDLISGAQASVGMIEGLIDRLAPAQRVPDVPEVGLPSVEGERKVVTRPWRIERLGYGGWYCLTTVTTKERAEQGLPRYRAHRYGPLRVRNRETGEVIGDSDA